MFASLIGFSNRLFRVKRFQTIHHCNVDVARGLALLYGLGLKALAKLAHVGERDRRAGWVLKIPFNFAQPHFGQNVNWQGTQLLLLLDDPNFVAHPSARYSLLNFPRLCLDTNNIQLLHKVRHGCGCCWLHLPWQRNHRPTADNNASYSKIHLAFICS
jgi:hypothetical protein